MTDKSRIICLNISYGLFVEVRRLERLRQKPIPSVAESFLGLLDKTKGKRPYTWVQLTKREAQWLIERGAPYWIDCWAKKTHSGRRVRHPGNWIVSLRRLVRRTKMALEAVGE